MGWKMTGRPTVRQQRGKWVVRVDGVDTATGKPRPRQIGTYPSRHAAAVAASAAAARGAGRTGKGTVGWAVERWVHSRSDVGESTRAQYEWAAGHIAAGIGGLKLEDLDREDVVRWLDELAADGRFGRRRIQIFRTVLRAALADAVDRGDLQRSPASRVGMPRAVAKAPSQKAVRAWDQEQTGRFLREAAKHRWGPALRLAVLYGLRRSELLGLRGERHRLRRFDADHRARPGGSWREGHVDRGQERQVSPDDPARPVDAGRAGRVPAGPGRGTPGRRRPLGGERRVRGHEARPSGVARQLQLDAGHDREAGRRAAPVIARPAPHRGHVDGPPRRRPWRGASRG